MKVSRVKKISSLMVMLAVLMVMLAGFGTTNVYAALTSTTAYNWHVHNASSPDGTVTRDTEVKHSGNASLHVNLNSGTIYLSNPYANIKFKQNTKYRLEMYIKKVTDNNKTRNLVWDSQKGTAQAGLYGSIMKREDETVNGEATGWTRHYIDITTSDNPVLYFILSGTINYYIDDVTLYEYDSENVLGDENLIEDGTFEATAAISYGTYDDIEGYTVGNTYKGKYVPGYMYAQMNTDMSNVRTGNGSLRLVRGGYANKYPAPTIQLVSTVRPTAGNSYKLTYYVKDDGDTSYKEGTIAENDGTAGIFWELGGKKKNVSNETAFTRTADAEHTGWDKLETTFENVTSKDALKVTFQAHFDGYIDDISLYLLSGGEPTGSNLIEYGTFDYEVPDPNDYEPSNPFIISTLKTGGVNNISWRNPIKETLNKVSMYKLASDNETWQLVSDAYSAVPGTVFEEYDADLSAGTVYTYKLRFDFSDGERREVILSKDPKANGYNDRTAGNTWKITDRASGDGNQYFIPNNAVIDTTEKASGTASLHMFTNKTYNATNRPALSSGVTWTIHYWSRLQQTLTGTDASKYYKLSYKIKVNNATKVQGTSNQAIIGGGSRNTSNAPYSTGSTDGWVEKTLQFSPNGTTAAGPFMWYIGSDDVQDLWIDDIALYELTGKGGEIVGDNLLSDGGFEDYTAAGEITGYSVAGYSKKAYIEWTAPADSRYIRVYEVTENGDMLRAVCEPYEGSVMIENLTNNTNYTFKLQSQNNKGVLSPAVTVSATPTPPAYEIDSDYVIKLNGTQVSDVTAAGTYSVSLDMTNYSRSSFKPALIVALYVDDILKDYAYTDSVIAADGISKTISESVTVSSYDASKKYKICAFFWDGFDTMKSIYHSTSWENSRIDII